MKMTFACPNCNAHKSTKGNEGEKKLLICNKCGAQGFAQFPLQKTNKKKISKNKISARQLATISISLVLYLIMIYFHLSLNNLDVYVTPFQHLYPSVQYFLL